jgi:hypothetical protein
MPTYCSCGSPFDPTGHVCNYVWKSLETQKELATKIDFLQPERIEAALIFDEVRMDEIERRINCLEKKVIVKRNKEWFRKRIGLERGESITAGQPANNLFWYILGGAVLFNIIVIILVFIL